MNHQALWRSVLDTLLSVWVRRFPAQVELPAQTSQPPVVERHDVWNVFYPEVNNQSWRTEPEIDEKRKAELDHRRCTIIGDFISGNYPLKDMKLNRADVEWLLATHENGVGPVKWSEESQRKREGLDLRGAHLQGENLSRLPLARLRASLTKEEQDLATEDQCSQARIHLEKAILEKAELQGANLHHAYLDEADFTGALLEEANLTDARLQKANLLEAQLQKAD